MLAVKSLFSCWEVLNCDDFWFLILCIWVGFPECWHCYCLEIKIFSIHHIQCGIGISSFGGRSWDSCILWEWGWSPDCDYHESCQTANLICHSLRIYTSHLQFLLNEHNLKCLDVTSTVILTLIAVSLLAIMVYEMSYFWHFYISSEVHRSFVVLVMILASYYGMHELALAPLLRFCAPFSF